MAYCRGLPTPGIKPAIFPATSPTDSTTLSPNLAAWAPVVLMKCPTFLAANVFIEVRMRSLALIHFLVGSPVTMPFPTFYCQIKNQYTAY